MPDKKILAIVALTQEKIMSGGAPIFLASSVEEREKVAAYLGRILDAQVHDLENGTYILVRH